MNKKTINPLNVHNVRRAKFCPPYFEEYFIPQGTGYGTQNVVNQWIDNNLSGAYYVGETVLLDDNTYRNGTIVAFEKASELSLFMLSCPYLK